MKATRNPGLFIGLIILLAACNKVTYRKTAGGMPYKLFKGDGKRKISEGSIVKYNVMYKIKDSIYFSTFGRPPMYTRAAKNETYDISELWSSLSVGDSIMTTQMMDTFIKRDPTRVPPYFKKGGMIITYFKILDVLPADSTVFADQKMERERYIASEIKYIEDYLAGKKIKARKTPSGAFVEIIDPGTGDLIDSGNYVYVNYSGVTFGGKKFDSNIDSTFQHVGPLTFSVGDGTMVKGFDEPMLFLKPGGKAKVYVPSMLAYGPNPRPGSGIKPYEHLIFDLTVIDVKEKMPVAPAPGKDVKIDQPQ
ncbi:MAG: FKBP-type peptidyl-prolyl cis-trans isomerase [Chitinophagaceae bacterium]|nr:FKBP-type peptidyl-prolyl cis-trans isomerase [Chitinophagaceae bacterium]